ncbi:hypothetical protein ACFC0S_16265 [Streptomyces sp. NPDC056084]|uniref:hypothetical protein n=1 Tax=unclassified Streptomyces TaxID=2593676 RepID=UPI0035E089C5
MAKTMVHPADEPSENVTVRTIGEIFETVRHHPADVWSDDYEVLYTRAFVACGGKTPKVPTASTAANTEAVAPR